MTILLVPSFMSGNKKQSLSPAVCGKGIDSFCFFFFSVLFAEPIRSLVEQIANRWPSFFLPSQSASRSNRFPAIWISSFLFPPPPPLTGPTPTRPKGRRGPSARRSFRALV